MKGGLIRNIVNVIKTEFAQENILKMGNKDLFL